jgi:ubiquitin-protein ligase E3 A
LICSAPCLSSILIASGVERVSYVELYVKYLLEDSIHEQFDAFYDGFYQVCGGPALGLFRHEELELLICGLPHFDFDALERVTIYHNGYSKDSQIIKWFWEVVKSMSLDEKKQLLFFTTGNDRAPVGGLATLKFIITRNGDDTDRLPTAHTCFNILMLPNYSSKEKFENRLKLAIANSTGFGLQ